MMAITTGKCASFKLEAVQGIHDFGTDTFKIALYSDAANIDPEATSVYTPTGEVVGSGYVAGGIALSVSDGYPAYDADTQRAVIRFDDAVWSLVTLSARGALIYNASKANRAIVALDFGALLSPVNGPLSVKFPIAGPPAISFG